MGCLLKTAAALFTNASELGVSLPQPESQAFATYLRENVKPLPGLHQTGSCMRRRGYHSRTPVTLVDDASTVVKPPVCNQDVIGFVFTRGFIFRFNAAFRSIVNHKVVVIIIVYIVFQLTLISL